MSIKRKIISYSIIFLIIYVISLLFAFYLNFRILNEKKSREFYESFVLTCGEIRKLMYKEEKKPVEFFQKFSNTVLKISKAKGVILYDKEKYEETEKGFRGVSFVFGKFVILGKVKPEFLKEILSIEVYGSVGSLLNPIFVSRYPLLWRGNVVGYLLAWKEANNLSPVILSLMGISSFFLLLYLVFFLRYIGLISRNLKLLIGIINGVAKNEFSRMDFLRENIRRSKDKDGELYEMKIAIIKMIENIEKILIETSKEKTIYERMALTDPLTGLYNRRIFMEMAEKELARAKRYGYNFSILMIDIDNFKRINDTYGHDVGDYVLKKIAEILRTNVRGADIVARFGGEEFIVMLSNTNLNNAVKKAEKLRKMIEQTPVELSSGVKLKVTVSVGVSTYKDQDSLEELIKEADVALYEAKKRGKNRVEVFKGSLAL
ncbi:MAG: hypothetical protein DSY32_01015 [Aquifex sp.]|nr:MAG: hypothetical protein DSY32_01015 [Aquifex sp.]